MTRVTAVIPVWGDGRFLPELLASLHAQREPITILAVSSNCTDNARATLAEAGVPLTEHPGGSIGADWNAGVSAADTECFFIAHQDDTYAPDYAATLADLLTAGTTLAWCSYNVTGDGATAQSDRLPVAKRAMNELFAGGRTRLRTTRAKQWLNAFGPVIACPTVMFRTAALADFDFSTTHRVNLDWDAWWRLAEQSGSFARSRDQLVTIRLHAESESTAGKAAGVRKNEDLELLNRYWPAPVARIVQRTMELAY